MLKIDILQTFSVIIYLFFVNSNPGPLQIKYKILYFVLFFKVYPDFFQTHQFFNLYHLLFSAFTFYYFLVHELVMLFDVYILFSHFLTLTYIIFLTKIFAFDTDILI